jgi:hypothetical protein
MCKHALIATDGSPASEKALAQGLLLSRMRELTGISPGR